MLNSRFKNIIKRFVRKVENRNGVPFRNIQKNKKKKPNKQRFLMFAIYEENSINTVKETINELICQSRYSIDLINVLPTVALEKDFDFFKYDGIIIHNTMNYFVENIERMDSLCDQKIAKFPGVKVMFKQDEHYRQNLLIDYLEQTDFDLIVTICDDNNVDLFYPSERLPRLRHLNYLTGYVREYHKHLPYHDVRNRAIDVGYRGSIQPPVAGMLSYEKRQIGWEFEKHAARRGLVTDISSEWKDRITGDNWYAFMGSCKAQLGVESGASIVDLDGSVEADYKSYIEAHPDAKDEEVLAYLKKYENGPQYRAISPRHFEAAACFSVQVMYEGRFQDIFLPDRHYIPLRRDWGNVDEVIDRLMNDTERERIATCAYEEIILNPKYSYVYFVEQFDRMLGEILKSSH